jgi:hypothetical protein
MDIVPRRCRVSFANRLLRVTLTSSCLLLSCVLTCSRRDEAVGRTGDRGYAEIGSQILSTDVSVTNRVHATLQCARHELKGGKCDGE